MGGFIRFPFLAVFCLCQLIWRRNSVVSWGCSGRPPPGGAPRRLQPRP